MKNTNSSEYKMRLGIFDQDGEEISVGDVLERTDIVMVAGKCIKTVTKIEDILNQYSKYNSETNRLENYKKINKETI